MGPYFQLLRPLAQMIGLVACGVIMHLLLSIVVIGSAFVVVLGAWSFVRDLLAVTKHPPPSVFDALREDDQEPEDRNRRGVLPYPIDEPASLGYQRGH